MASTYPRISVTPLPAASLLRCITCAKRSLICPSTVSVSTLTSSSGEPSSIAFSATGTTGPCPRPAGLSPVKGAPSPALWILTTVSKKCLSATSLASGLCTLAFITFSKASVTSGSPSSGTKGRTALTPALSSATIAALTTGPSIESQCGGISIHSFLTDAGEHSHGGGNLRLESYIRLKPTGQPLLLLLAPGLVHVRCSGRGGYHLGSLVPRSLSVAVGGVRPPHLM